MVEVGADGANPAGDGVPGTLPLVEVAVDPVVHPQHQRYNVGGNGGAGVQEL